MAPIRIGFIGLSAQGSWATNSHLPYLKQTERFVIAALCNTTVAAAEAARAKYSLPPSTKCYGSPEDLANDPDIDLIVCSVRVDLHYAVLKSALEKGKSVYCEWPLAKDLEEAEALARIAKATGARTMIGLQARRSPVVLKVKELVESGRIGKVLSSNLVSSSGNHGPTETEGLRYITQREIGGNMVSIDFCHIIDYVCFTLGELGDLNALLSIQRPTVDIVRSDGSKVETIKRTSHDQIIVHGHLASGAVLSAHHRGGKPFKDEPGLNWSIYEEKGEIYVTADGPFLQLGYPKMVIRVHDAGSDEVETIDWASSAGPEEKLPSTSRDVARMYEAWADDKPGSYLDMQQCIVRHKMLDKIYKSSDSTTWTSYL